MFNRINNKQFYFIEELSYKNEIYNHNVYAKIDNKVPMLININNLYMLIGSHLHNTKREILYSSFNEN